MNATDPTGVPELIGTPDVAKLLDVNQQRVRQLVRERDDFPTPALVVSRRMLWHRADIERWRDTANRSPGRRAS